MRKFGAWGLVATLVVALGAAVAGAAEGDSEAASPKTSLRAPTWQSNPFAGWFSPKDDKEEKKPVAKRSTPRSEQTAMKKPPLPSKRGSLVDEAAAERRRQEAALLRRLQACDKLKEIALRTNDSDLLHRAEELEERAQTCYAQRTSHLPVSAGSFESDDKVLDQYLEPGKSQSLDSSPYTVSSKDSGIRAAEEEDKP